MDREQLLKDFLGGFPESLHEKDTDRFLKYAVACTLEGVNIDLDALSDAGLSEKAMEQYQVGFEWIRDTVNYVLANYRNW